MKLVALLCLAAAAGPAKENSPFVFRDGDLIVLVGDTLVERDQRYGYLETDLLARYPKLKLRFRNLGWSGDTVTGISRAYFDPPAQGTVRLFEQVTSEKPNVLIVGYGMADSFAGPAGLEAFQTEYVRFLDTAAKSADRVALLSPLPVRVPDGASDAVRERASVVQQYTAAIGAIANNRRHRFVELFDPAGKRLHPLQRGSIGSPPPRPIVTDNGIHLSERGYWLFAMDVEEALRLPPQPVQIDIDVAKKTAQSTGAVIENLQLVGDGFTFRSQSDRLPSPRPHENQKVVEIADSQATTIVLKVAGLSEGTHALTIDDKPVRKATAEEWAKGVTLTGTPQDEQVEQLRRLVIRKNHLYFNKYRPQNITYLLGFRKYEQGQNAKELDDLDKLVAETEARINELRIPRPHRFAMSKEEK